MKKIISRTNKGTDGKNYLVFRPYGFDSVIQLPVITSGTRNGRNVWTWNGSFESPTLNPSILATRSDGKIVHFWLNDGVCIYLSDSSEFAGEKKDLLLIGWTCEHSDGEIDHDWKHMADSSGEVDGGLGDNWQWRECRVCGKVEDSK